MRLLIIQTSPCHTASTLLINAIYGLIPQLEKKNIMCIWDKDICEKFKNNSIIVAKCHNTNIDKLIKYFSGHYMLAFICSERKEKNFLIDEKYKSYKNVLVFEYEQLNETTDNSLEKIVNTIHDGIKRMLPFIKLDKGKCINRLRNMNETYEQIKDKPFTYVDKFYHIHGSHRNRQNDS